MKKFAYQATQKLYALIVGIIFLLILFGQWCSFKLKKGFLKGVSVFWTICIAVLFFVRLIWFINGL